MKTAIRTLSTALAVATFLPPSPVSGQSAQSSADSPSRRFTVSWLGGASHGATQSVEGYMREIGFGDTKPGSCFFGLCGDPVSFPRSQAELATILSFKYRFWDQVAAQFVYATGGGANTRGWGSGRGSLDLAHHVTTFAALAIVEAGHVHLGLGPGLYSASLDNDVRGKVQSESKLGLLADAGFEIPLHSRFFLDLRLQYRFVGSTVIDAPEWLDLSNVTGSISPIDFNHWFMGAGLGVRF